MAHQISGALLATLGIATFTRGADGSFASVPPVPAWFSRLVADPTFPFLGHILEEAGEFWREGAEGFREFGPCAEVDDSGLEFHYKVIAVTAPDGQFLLFQPDPATDRLRDVLQKARERVLRKDGDGDPAPLMSLLQHEALAAATEIRELVSRLDRAREPRTAVVLDAIAARCERLRTCVDSTRV